MKRIPLSKTALVLLITLALSSCGGGHRSITISGAFALYPLGVKWTGEYQKLHPDTRFDVSAGGAGKGLTDVVAGAADLAMFSRQLTAEEKKKDIEVFAVAKDAVVPTFSAQNPDSAAIHKAGLTHEELEKIFFSGKPVRWGDVLGNGDSARIVVYTRSDAAGAADTWAAYFGKRQENIRGVGIYSDPGVADAVSRDPHGLGFNNVAYAYDVTTGKKRPGVDVVPIDRNANGVIDPAEAFYGSADSLLHAIADGRYPSPPARDLYFITSGKPTDPAIIAFLKWVLTDGQRYVKAAGYVPLPAAELQAQLDKLK
jgi:phosphate transport system substrate-binding protein